MARMPTKEARRLARREAEVRHRELAIPAREAIRTEALWAEMTRQLEAWKQARDLSAFLMDIDAHIAPLEPEEGKAALVWREWIAARRDQMDPLKGSPITFPIPSEPTDAEIEKRLKDR